MVSTKYKETIDRFGKRLEEYGQVVSESKGSVLRIDPLVKERLVKVIGVLGTCFRNGYRHLTERWETTQFVFEKKVKIDIEVEEEVNNEVVLASNIEINQNQSEIDISVLKSKQLAQVTEGSENKRVRELKKMMSEPHAELTRMPKTITKSKLYTQKSLFSEACVQETYEEPKESKQERIKIEIKKSMLSIDSHKGKSNRRKKSFDISINKNYFFKKSVDNRFVSKRNSMKSQKTSFFLSKKKSVLTQKHKEIERAKEINKMLTRINKEKKDRILNKNKKETVKLMKNLELINNLHNKREERIKEEKQQKLKKIEKNIQNIKARSRNRKIMLDSSNGLMKKLIKRTIPGEPIITNTPNRPFNEKLKLRRKQRPLKESAPPFNETLIATGFKYKKKDRLEQKEKQIHKELESLNSKIDNTFALKSKRFANIINRKPKDTMTIRKSDYNYLKGLEQKLISRLEGLEKKQREMEQTYNNSRFFLETPNKENRNEALN